jgi:hypothetical protein
MKDLDLSAFDEVMSVPDEELDLSAFDEAVQPQQTSFIERLAGKAKNLVTPDQDTIDTATGLGESVLDFSKGVAKGATFNALDEVGGMLGAGVERGLGALGIGPAAVDAQLREQGFTGSGVEESLTDTYRGYQQGIEQDLKASEERSPFLMGAGELAGGIASGTALSGAMGLGKVAKGTKTLADIAKDSGKSKAALELLKRGGKGYAKMAPAIAAEAALTSEKQLIGEDSDVEGLAGDVVGGLAFGAPLVLGLEGGAGYLAPRGKEALGKVGKKIGELAAESPLARQAKIAYETYGKKAKINPRSEKAILEGVEAIEGGTPFSRINTKRAEDITNKVLAGDKELGKLVGQSLDEASQAGLRVSADDIVQDTFQKVVTLSQELPSVLQDKNFNATMQKALQRNYTNASPREIKNAIEDITNSIDRIDAMKYVSPELGEASQLLRQFRRGLDGRLKESVPQYRDAAERFAQYRRAYMEQPISGRFDPDLDDIMYGDLKKGQKKLVEAYENLVSSTTADTQAVEGIEATYSKLAESTKKFQQEEAKRMAAGKIKAPIGEDSEQFMKQIKNFADDAAVRRATRKTQETQGGAKVGIKDLSGLAQTGRGAVLSTSYLAGKAAASKPGQAIAKMSRNLYNLPSETLNGVANKLEANPVTSMYGKALREGLESGDVGKKNAAIFTIMQNPNARMSLEEDLED